MNKTTFLVLVAVILLAGAGYYLWYSDASQPSSTTTDGTQTPSPSDDADTSSQMPVNSGENPEPGSTVHDLPVEPAAAAARKDLAARLNVDEKSIVIMLVEEKTWSDGCLGLAGAEEFCTQGLVNGFRVEMEYRGKTYVYRTDKTGASVRTETKITLQ
jgi:hypothetical protein